MPAQPGGWPAGDQDFSHAMPSLSRSDFLFALYSAVEVLTVPLRGRFPDAVRLAFTPLFAMPPLYTLWISAQFA